jgi:beta-lactamase class A
MIKTALVIVLGLSTFLYSCSGSKHVKKSAEPAVEKAPATVPETKPVAEKPGFLEQLLAGDERMKSFLSNRDSLKIQVIYTQIDRDKDNKPKFTDHFFNVDAGHYFYPASTVKLPTALLALEKLNTLKQPGLNAGAAMVTENGYGEMTAVFNDPNTPDGRPSIAQYVKRVFLVSDNNAQNRMYEFLGQQYLNKSLWSKGYKEAQVIHRLDITLSEDENRHTNPVRFFDSSGNMVYSQPMVFNNDPYLQRNDRVGTGFMRNGQVVNEPMDFSIKNRISLSSLHNILRSVIFPESVKPEQQFRLTGDDLALVRKYMSMYPGESTFPFYDTATYYPAYCKFLLYGSDKNARILPQVRIFNKVGDAFGFLLDIAYVADFEHKVEFMVSAVIYCNKDGIINDDKYDYEETGYPFMKYLGEDIYRYELNRTREHKPDLSTFMINYSSSAVK